MTTIRKYIEVIQQREFAPRKDCVGMEWLPRIEVAYEFYSVQEFLKKFPPIKPSDNLLNAIRTAFINCSSVTFNVGDGNKTFKFSKL